MQNLSLVVEDLDISLILIAQLLQVIRHIRSMPRGQWNFNLQVAIYFMVGIGAVAFVLAVKLEVGGILGPIAAAVSIALSAAKISRNH